MSAQQDRLDRAMLQSMAASFASGMAFSFNRQDMAELMLRMADRVKPTLSALKPAAPTWHRMDDPANPPPMDGTEVIVAVHHDWHGWRQDIAWNDGGMWKTSGQTVPGSPTHWRHLDAPPSPAEGGDHG